MSTTSHFNDADDPTDKADDAVSVRPVEDRLIDHIATSTLLIPILVIAVAIWYLGFSTLYIAALAAGVVVWGYWGKRMTSADGKLALVVDVESGEITPYVIGRNRWTRAKKIGRPFLNFRTPAGATVEVIQSYDPSSNVITWPPATEYSDLYIASIPDRYGSLIDELVSLNAKVMTSKNEIDLCSVKIARDHNKKLMRLVDDLISPKAEADNDK